MKDFEARILALIGGLVSRIPNFVQLLLRACDSQVLLPTPLLPGLLPPTVPLPHKACSGETELKNLLGSRNPVGPRPGEWDGSMLAQGPARRRTGQGRPEKKLKMDDAMERLRLAADLSERRTAAETSLPDADGVTAECGAWGVNAQLRRHQAEGIAWLIRRYARGVNVILGDEMGLGKTLQSVTLLSYLVSQRRCSGPFLILSPLSVIQGWASELARFSANLRVLEYVGDKNHREDLQKTICLHVNEQPVQSRSDPALPFDVLLTTYELAVLDAMFLSRFRWRYTIIDEAQRLKNPSTVLYRALQGQYMIPRRLLLTGTPLQNNLSELWALLHFCMPHVFDDLSTFLDAFGTAAETSQEMSESLRGHESDIDDARKGPLELLRHILGAFMLRRTKDALVQSKALVLPPMAEITLCAPLVPVQKKVYVSVLRREAPRIAGRDSDSTSKQSLNNIVVQLRKACSHPYLFEGVEPEPFKEGEHLVQASGKLVMLDMMLKRLHSGGHHVLIFAQMTRTLDILQDYLQFRGYTYERLDGSVRAEERFAAVRSFSGKRNNGDSDAAFIFLLTTRAGGVGLNLIAADTVIFYEQDWNPQADKQAMQRAHRMGQRRSVLAINLIVENTFEEVIRQRAIAKLQLMHNVIGRDKADDAQGPAGIEKTDLQSVIVFGLHKILSQPGQDKEPDDNEELAAKLVAVVEKALDQRPKADSADFQVDGLTGVDPSPVGDAEEEAERLVHLFREEVGNADANLSALKSLETNRDKATVEAGGHENGGGRRPRQGRSSDASEAAAEEAAARKKRKKEEVKLSLWSSLGYSSLAVDEPKGIPDNDRQAADDDEYIHHLVGDCTKPGLAEGQNGVILWCVDDSGMWGSGGVFTAVERLSQRIPEAFEDAHEAQDLHLGDLHLIAVPECSADTDEQVEKHGSARLWVALAIVQSFDRRRKVARSGISFPDLEVCIRKVAASAAGLSASVHMPRIQAGDGWYMVERLLRKYATMYHVHFNVYYYKRRVD